MSMLGMKDGLTTRDDLAGCSVKHAIMENLEALEQLPILNDQDDGGIVVSQAPNFNWKSDQIGTQAHVGWLQVDNSCSFLISIYVHSL